MQHAKSVHFDIVMAVRNGQTFLPEMLLSLSQQSLPITHTYIGLDNSVDHSLEICRAANIPKQLFEFKFNSADKTFLKLLEFSDCPYVFFADQDDIWRPDRCLSVIELLLDNNVIDLVYSDVINIDSEGNLIQFSKHSKRLLLSPPSGLFSNPARGCTIVISGNFRNLILSFVSQNRVRLAYDHLLFLFSDLMGVNHISSVASVNYRHHKDSHTFKFQKSSGCGFYFRIRSSFKKLSDLLWQFTEIYEFLQRNNYYIRGEYKRLFEIISEDSSLFKRIVALNGFGALRTSRFQSFLIKFCLALYGHRLIRRYLNNS